MKNIILLLLSVLTFSACHNGYQYEKQTAVYLPAKRTKSKTRNTAGASHYCGHTTRKGGACKRKVAGTTGYCWQHR